METSNSKQQSGISALELLQGRKIKQEEIRQEDWGRLISDLAGQLNPRLKYLSGLDKFHCYMNRGLSGNATVTTDKKFFVGGYLDPKIPVARICSIRDPEDDFFKDHTGSSDHDLLYTVDGDFVSCRALYKPNNPRSYTTIKMETEKVIIASLPLTQIQRGVSVSFFAPLRSGVDAHYGTTVGSFSLGARIFCGLTLILSQTVQRRQEYLNELKAILDGSKEILGRMEGFRVEPDILDY